MKMNDFKILLVNLIYIIFNIFYCVKKNKGNFFSKHINFYIKYNKKI